MSDMELRAKLGVKKNKARLAVAGIVKTGQNRAQNYAYAEEAEVVKEVRRALCDAGIDFSVAVTDCIPTHDIPTKSGSMKHFVIKMTCSLTDTETGFTETQPWAGGGADSGDKAIWKAMTGGVKYFLMKTLLLPTGDDPESFKDVDEPPETKAKQTNQKKGAKPEEKKAPTTPEEITKQAWEEFTGEHWDKKPDEYEWSYDKFVEAIKAMNKGSLLLRKESIPKVLEALDPVKCWIPKTKNNAA